MNGTDYLYLGFAIAVFIAVVLLVEGLYTTWNSNYGPEAKRIAQRLRIMSAGARETSEEVKLVKQRLLSKIPKVQRILLSIPRVQRIDRLLEQAGSRLDVSQLMAVSAIAWLLSFVLFLFIRMPFWIAIWPAIGVAALPTLYLVGKKHARLKKFEEQLPDALDLMGRAMRAGHAFPSALQMVGNEMKEPIAHEFAIVFDEVNFGIPMPEALKNLGIRVPSIDLNYFIVAVLIQRETGGNLAELLNNISTIIRARFRLFGQINVLTAEGRLSAWILCLLPFVMAALLFVINPGYVSLLWLDPTGVVMMGMSIIMMIIGVFWMRQLIRIRV